MFFQHLPHALPCFLSSPTKAKPKPCLPFGSSSCRVADCTFIVAGSTALRDVSSNGSDWNVRLKTQRHKDLTTRKEVITTVYSCLLELPSGVLEPGSIDNVLPWTMGLWDRRYSKQIQCNNQHIRTTTRKETTNKARGLEKCRSANQSRRPLLFRRDTGVSTLSAGPISNLLVYIPSLIV